jgi:hypothetical protein
MKILSLTLGLLLSSLSFSQQIIIHVFEKQEMVSFHKTTLDSVISNPDYINEIDISHTRYVLDLNKKTSSYSYESSKISVLPIDYEIYGDGVLKVRILEDGFDYGLIINTKDETVLWYWFTDYQTTVKKISKCYFEKSS